MIVSRVVAGIAGTLVPRIEGGGLFLGGFGEQLFVFVVFVVSKNGGR